MVIMSEPTFDDRRTSFGEAAAAYAEHRPGYPDDAVSWALGAARGSVARVADVGAGTGALTATLVARGLEVHAVEPDAAMLSELGRRVPLAHSHHSAAESMPLDDAFVDAVLVAQAWHWLDHSAAAEEFARVVRPGGAVGLLWNVRLVDEGWMREVDALIGGESSMRAAVRKEAPDEATPIVLGPRWSAPERAAFRHDVTMSADSLVRLVDTYSYVRLSPDSADVLDAVRAIAQAHAASIGRDTFPLSYMAVVYRATRSGT